NTFLAKSKPIVITCMWTVPSSDSSLTITLWHIDAGSGRRPPHHEPTFDRSALDIANSMLWPLEEAAHPRSCAASQPMRHARAGSGVPRAWRAGSVGNGAAQGFLYCEPVFHWMTDLPRPDLYLSNVR